MVPALDDLADAELELERVAAVNAAVELGAVEEGAGVVDGDLGAGLGALVSRALHENLLHASAILELGDVRLLANLEVLVHHVLVVAHAGHVGAHVVHRSGSAERQDGGRGRDDRQSAIFRRLSNSFASRDPRRSPRAHSPTREREEGKKREGSTEGICSRTLVCVWVGLVQFSAGVPCDLSRSGGVGGRLLKNWALTQKFPGGCSENFNPGGGID